VNVTAAAAHTGLNPDDPSDTCGLVAYLDSVPGVRRNTMGEQVHLYRGAGREYAHHGAGRRLDFRSRLAHLHPGDPLDLLPQRVGGVGEQVSVKVLYLSGTLGLFARAFSASDKAPCSVITSVVSLSTTVTDLGVLPVLCCSKALPPGRSAAPWSNWA